MTVTGLLGTFVTMLLCISQLKSGFSPYHPPLEIETRNCVFPFIYQDVTYYTCTSKHSDYAWCSFDYQFNGHWRYCTANDQPSCVFPFMYGDALIFRCTKKNYVLGRSWCSLTKNFNQDRKWKPCSPFNT